MIEHGTHPFALMRRSRGERWVVFVVQCAADVVGVVRSGYACADEQAHVAVFDYRVQAQVRSWLLHPHSQSSMTLVLGDFEYRLCLARTMSALLDYKQCPSKYCHRFNPVRAPMWRSLVRRSRALPWLAVAYLACATEWPRVREIRQLSSPCACPSEAQLRLCTWLDAWMRPTAHDTITSLSGGVGAYFDRSDFLFRHADHRYRGVGAYVLNTDARYDLRQSGRRARLVSPPAVIARRLRDGHAFQRHLQWITSPPLNFTRVRLLVSQFGGRAWV